MYRKEALLRNASRFTEPPETPLWFSSKFGINDGAGGTFLLGVVPVTLVALAIAYYYTKGKGNKKKRKHKSKSRKKYKRSKGGDKSKWSNLTESENEEEAADNEDEEKAAGISRDTSGSHGDGNFQVQEMDD